MPPPPVELGNATVVVRRPQPPTVVASRPEAAPTVVVPRRGVPGIPGADGLPGQDGAPGADGVPGQDGADATWTQVTQAEYDALAPPDPGTLYVVIG